MYMGCSLVLSSSLRLFPGFANFKKKKKNFHSLLVKVKSARNLERSQTREKSVSYPENIGRSGPCQPTNRLIFRESPRRSLKDSRGRSRQRVSFTTGLLYVHGVGCIHERKRKKGTSPSLFFGRRKQNTRTTVPTTRSPTIFISPYCRARCRIADGASQRRKRERDDGGKRRRA